MPLFIQFADDKPQLRHWMMNIYKTPEKMSMSLPKKCDFVMSRSACYSNHYIR